MVEGKTSTLEKMRTILILVGVAVVIVVIFVIIPGPEKDKGVDIVSAFNDIQELATAEADVTTIAAKKEKSILGKRWLAIQLSGFVQARFDLSAMDIKTKGDEIIITLPDKIINELNFPPEKTEVLFMDKTFLAGNFPPEKILLEEQRVEEKIKEELEKRGLLKAEAKKNLEVKLKLLEMVVNKKITTKFIEEK
jgi:hypothetical protein